MLQRGLYILQCVSFDGLTGYLPGADSATGNRLATLLIEESMRFLPSRSKSITTDTGYLYEGTELDVEVGARFLTP